MGYDTLCEILVIRFVIKMKIIWEISESASSGQAEGGDLIN